MQRLNEAREVHNLELTTEEKTRDRKIYVRNVIGKAEERVAMLLTATKAQMELDRQAKLQHIQSGQQYENLNKAHPAYPLITSKILKIVLQQCLHLLNGCASDKQPMHAQTGEANYRNTGTHLPTYKSMRGTSKCEAVHSVAEKLMHAFNNIREVTYDARMEWMIINYNRKILRRMSKPALPESVAPSEVSQATCPPIVPSTDFLFGYQYYHRVKEDLEDEIQAAVMAELNNDAVEIADLDIDGIAMDDSIEMGLSDDKDDAATDLADNASALSDGASLGVEIPDAVDFPALTDIGLTLLETDVDVNVDINSLVDGVNIGTAANDEGIVTAVKEGASSTMASCLARADEMAAEAGMDVSNAATEQKISNARSANGKRNVALRRQQAQKAISVSPDFNSTMEKKWLDLIADPSIPDPTNSKTSIRGWYSKACLAYEKWRFLQIIKYTDEADAPPLFPVDFNLAVAWMEKMKKVSKKPQSLGIVNEESRQISTQMEALVNNANSANQDRTFGNATNISSLTTAAPAAVTAGAPLFIDFVRQAGF
jgi:hypothetical protein